VYPENLLYTAEHEWVTGSAAAGATIRVGITDYAQEQLGDIVYVNLPEVGAEVAGGEPMGELESTKSVSDVFAPLTGVITAVNGSLDGTPELCNSDPYGDGWLVEMTVSDDADLDPLLGSQDYEAQVASQ
jgi:glycine cleavage system H protein